MIIKKKITATLGILTEDGTQYLGISTEKDKGRKILYNLKDDTFKVFGTISDIDIDQANDLEEEGLAYACGDKGAYFFTNYEFDKAEEEFTKCNLEIYNKLTLKLEHSIPVSNMDESWFDSCRVIEAAKLDDENYIIIYYYNFYDCDSISVGILNTVHETADVLKLIVEDDKILNARFNVETREILYDVVIDDLVSRKDEWISKKYILTEDYKNLIEGRHAITSKIFEDEYENKSMFRYYDIGIDYLGIRNGLLSKVVRVSYDRIGKRELDRVVLPRKSTYEYYIASEMNIFILSVGNTIKDIVSLKFFEKDQDGFTLVDEMKVACSSLVEYYENLQIIAVKEKEGTTFITKKE